MKRLRTKIKNTVSWSVSLFSSAFPFLLPHLAWVCRDEIISDAIGKESLPGFELPGPLLL